MDDAELFSNHFVRLLVFLPVCSNAIVTTFSTHGLHIQIEDQEKKTRFCGRKVKGHIT